MKLVTRGMVQVSARSPSARGRGLKLVYSCAIGPHCLVALRAGAWIETVSGRPLPTSVRRSPSVRGRGLKQGLFVLIRKFVASPSVRGRGLKRGIGETLFEVFESPSVRGRGLKL